jgi:RNA polymerase sigma factor (sigma-70 family)
MTEETESLEKVLERAVRGDELALLQLSRRVTKLLRGFGAYSVERDWSALTHDITLAAVDSWKHARGHTAASHLESIAKNTFWGSILQLMTESHAGATNLFFPTVRRLLSYWDGAGRLEADWDDIVQDAAYQLWKLSSKGGIEKPWSMICTVAKRRYLDRIRGQRPTDEIDDRIEAAEADDPSQGAMRFTEQALAVLKDQERDIIVRMDIEGATRASIAEDLEMSEGQVLSLRRAGLRRIWRWLGADLAPPLREVWLEAFKGASRGGPETIAKSLGIGASEVEERLGQARRVLGLG